MFCSSFSSQVTDIFVLQSCQETPYEAVLTTTVAGTWLIICITALWTFLGNVVCECTVHAERDRCGNLSLSITPQISHPFTSCWLCCSYNSSMPLLFHMATIQQRDETGSEKTSLPTAKEASLMWYHCQK